MNSVPLGCEDDCLKTQITGHCSCIIDGRRCEAVGLGILSMDALERRWNSGTPVCCNGLEANGILKVPHAQKDKADTSSGHSWDARKQFTRAAFTLATTTIGYFLLVSLLLMSS